MQLILTLVVALAGGAAALRLKVPAGAMIGAMFSVAVFNIFTGAAFFPQDMKLYTQIAAGAFIGAGISYKNVMEIKSIFRPAVIMVFLMLTLNLLMGFIAYKTTEMGLVTSLFAFAPGGIVDISLISGDFGADTSKVALMQLVRLIGVLTIFPTLLKFVSNVYNSKFNAVASPNGAEASDGQS